MNDDYSLLLSSMVLFLHLHASPYTRTLQPRHMTTSMLEKCLSSGDVTRRKRSLNQSDDGAYALSSLPPPIPAITGTSSSSSLSPSSSSQTVASGLSLSLKGPTTALQFEGHSDCEGQSKRT